MKTIILSLLFSITLVASTITQPVAQFEVNGAVTDIVYKDHKLYCATDASCVNVMDIETQKILQTIKVAQITDFMGDIIDAKIYSVDVLNEQVLLLSQAEHGYRKIDIFQANKLSTVLPTSKKLYVAKAKFLNETTLLLALLSNDIISYNIKTQKYNWIVQASQSKFSNFVLSEDKSEVVVADESGNLHIYDTRDGTLLKTLSGQNLDNVFQVDYKNNIIATAGQDRRVVVYDLTSDSAYYKISKFLIYSVGISPNGKIIAYSSDENNNVTLFNTNTKATIGVYGGNKMIPVKILFINDNQFFVATDDRVINSYTVR